MPKVAVLFLTPACNMHCDFCGAAADFEPIPYDEAAALVDRLAAEGTQSMVLGGGEPFLWKHDIFHLARRIRQRGMIAQVGTNATLAPGADAALHEFDRWILPLESLSGAVHDAMRHFDGGHLHKIMQLLDRLRKNSVEATVSSLVTQENFDSLIEVGALLEWYQQHGGRLHAWHLYRFLPVGRGGRFNSRRFETGGGIFESLAELLKKRYAGLRVYARPDMYHSRETSFHWWQGGALQGYAAIAFGLAAAPTS